MKYLNNFRDGGAKLTFSRTSELNNTWKESLSCWFTW